MEPAELPAFAASASSRWVMSAGRGAAAAAAGVDTPAAARPAVSRRAMLLGVGAVAAALAAPPGEARAGKPTLRKSKEEILEEKRLAMEAEFTPEELEEKKLAAAEEKRKRLEKQRELMANKSSSTPVADATASDQEIEANLRANYYYPTARKRYLPRIKRVADQIDLLPGMVKSGDWKLTQEFTNDVIADAVGPMKLYASALSGQGLSLSGNFLKTLEKTSDDYESALKKMKLALKRKDTNSALAASDALTKSLTNYRIAAKINTPDGGVGEVPTDLRVGSGFGNNNPKLYERNYRSTQSASVASPDN